MGENSNAIIVEGLGKKFRLMQDRNWTLKATLLAGHRTRYEEFWALRDVSFEIPTGETFGDRRWQRLRQKHFIESISRNFKSR